MVGFAPNEFDYVCLSICSRCRLLRSVSSHLVKKTPTFFEKWSKTCINALMMTVAASPPVNPQICGDRAEIWGLFQVHIVLLAPRKVWANPRGFAKKIMGRFLTSLASELLLLLLLLLQGWPKKSPPPRNFETGQLWPPGLARKASFVARCLCIRSS